MWEIVSEPLARYDESCRKEGFARDQRRELLMVHCGRAVLQPTRLQFSLRALFAFITAVSLLLGFVHWLNWLSVCSAILWTTGWLQIVAMLWPIAIAVLWSFEAEARVYGKCVLALASLFIVHLLATILYLDALRGSPTTVDPIVFQAMLGRAFNWTVPSVAIGVVIGIYMGLTARTTFPYLAGCLLAAGGLLGFIVLGLGPYWLPLRPTELVWWM